MPWVWNLAAKRYRDTATGRFLARSTVLGYVQDSLDTARTAQSIALAGGVHSAGTDLLANLVANDMLSVADWHVLMREEIKREYLRQYMVGRGGYAQMTAVDWGSCGGMIGEQYRYLRDFAELVREGKLTEGQIKSRAAMYTNSAREGFERAQARVWSDATEVVWVLGPVKTEHCEDCEAFAAMGWQLIENDPYDGALPGSGDTACLSNCKCHLEYRTPETGEE